MKLGYQNRPEGGITAREIEVLQAIADGLETRGIAIKLGVAPKTAETHRNNMLHKLQVHNSAHAVATGFRRKLIY